MKRCLNGFSVLGVCLLVAASAWGQAGTNSGVIGGDVTDSTGAHVSGATVEIASPALIERVRDVQTGEDGLYKIVNVPPGTYTVTATQPGFNVAKRENVEVTTGFTATINFTLVPGSVNQTVTVSGEAPVLDSQDTVVQSILSNNVITSLPIGQSAADYPSLVPGAVGTATNQDVGGLRGENSQGFRVHGGASSDYAQLRDGMYYNTLKGAGNLMSSNNTTATQELQLETSGYSAEDWNAGGHINIIPKNGGNDLHGSFIGDFGLHSLQSSNITPAVQALGVPQAGAINSLYEFAGGIGGPIKKDKLWFFIDGRHWVSSSYQAGNTYFYDANEAAAFPNNLFYLANQSQRAYDSNFYSDMGLRLTWQASKRNQFTENFIQEINCNCIYQLDNGAVAPEASTNHYYMPNWREQATWTFPVNNKVVLWAGFSAVIGTINGTNSGALPTSIPVNDTSAGFTYGANDLVAGSPSTGGYARFQDINENFTVSYVTGPHSFKFGVTELQGGGDERDIYPTGANGYLPGVQLQMACKSTAGLPALELANDVPLATNPLVNSLQCPANQALLPTNLQLFNTSKFYTVNMYAHALFAQDQWRLTNRITLNLGARFDWFIGEDPVQTLDAAPQFGLPSKTFAAQTPVDLKDLNPRLGVAYDVFGNGKTVLKSSLVRGVLFEASTGITALTNPVLESVLNTTRSFTDTNGDMIPEGNFANPAANGELGAVASSGFNTLSSASNVTYSNDVTHGWFNRTYDYMFTVTAQQEIVRGFALSFDYYRTWYGNLTVAQNTAIPSSDYDPYCVTPPPNTFYGIGGKPLCNLYDPNPADFAGDKLPSPVYVVQQASNFGKESDVFTGIDVLANVKWRGLIVQGGVTAGHEVTNYCVQVNSPQDLYWTSNPSPLASSIIEFANNNFGSGGGQTNDAAPCYINPPWEQDLQFKVLATYTMKWGIKLSVNENNIPSIPEQATYTYSNTIGTFAFANGRTALANNNTTNYKVEVVAPQTIYPYARNNQTDFSVGKQFTFRERWKLEPRIDFFNLFNASTILSNQFSYNTSAPGTAGAFRNVTSLLPARMIKFTFHLDF